MEERQRLILDVSEMQMEAIKHFFLHSEWDFRPIDTSQEEEIGGKTCVRSECVDKGVQTNTELDTGPDCCGNDEEDNVEEEKFVIPQDNNRDECPFCLCKPCITDDNNRQLWWEVEPFRLPHPRNSKLRKEKYKRFWTMLLHRGVWSDPRYVVKKMRALEHFQPGQEWHRRDIMPTCVVNIVRTWLPNPKDVQYMGHLWE